MEVEIRLRQVLEAHGLNDRRVISRIATDLDVHRHTVGRIFHQQAQTVSLNFLGQLCEWLTEHGVAAQSLPAALFGVVDLWESLARAHAVTIWLGERSEDFGEGFRRSFISRQDAYAASNIIRKLSLRHDASPISSRYLPCTGDPGEDLRADFFKLATRSDDTASILIGSQRINPFTELFVAESFGAEPFASYDDRSAVPFHLVYRSPASKAPTAFACSDVTSCFGGNAPPGGYKGRAEPGLYFLNSHNEWEMYAWDAEANDCGIVISQTDLDHRRLDLALIGYTGRATDLLAAHLVTRCEDYWKQRIKVGNRLLSVSVCRIFAPNAMVGHSNLDASRVEVLPLSQKILSRFLATPSSDEEPR